MKDTTAKYVSTGSGNKDLPGFEGDVRDQRAFTLGTALWSSDSWRTAVEGAHLVAFSDWRQLPALCDALQAGGWLWRGIAAWDKTEASRPRNGGFRAQCEFMAWATRGPFPETGVYLDGCFRVLADRDKLHQAVKPLALMERHVTVAPAGELVVAPFAGSAPREFPAVRATLRVVATTNTDEIYAAISGLPVAERLKLVERVVHDIAEGQAPPPRKRDPKAIIGALSDMADVLEEVTEAAMVSRERDPLRLPNG